MCSVGEGTKVQNMGSKRTVSGEIDVALSVLTDNKRVLQLIHNYTTLAG